MFRVDHQAPVRSHGVGQFQLQDKHEIRFSSVRGGEETSPAENINPHHRIVRLERSIAWLKDQHGQMVASLHQEIETLKHRNRGDKHPVLLVDS